jgi:hypothetical protein
VAGYDDVAVGDAFHAHGQIAHAVGPLAVNKEAERGCGWYGGGRSGVGRLCSKRLRRKAGQGRSKKQFAHHSVPRCAAAQICASTALSN